MQVVYMVQQSSGAIDIASAEKLLKQSVNNAFNSYLYCLHFITQLALQVDLEEHRKKNKYLPTDDDRNFSTKFFKNPVIKFLIENSVFQSKLRKEKLHTLTDEEIVPVLYNQLKEFEPYKAYILDTENNLDSKSHKAIIHRIMNEFLCTNEYFDQHMEDVITTWADDEFIAKGLIEDIINDIPFSDLLNERYFEFSLTADEEEFVFTLLRYTISERDRFEKLIEPKLQNWELDRISIIDNILMRMALTEFLYLPTIPIKVSINEYLDISKLYSTPKSKEFINGVLDKVMIGLRNSGNIIKTGRGLIE
ncbi:MAG: transcription antitermination factor NusB [Chitinophagales bacterium]